MGKKIKTAVITILIFFFLPQGAYALEPFRGYNYDYYENAVPSPNGYTPDIAVTGAMLGIGDFNSPEDIFVDKATQAVYILDSGNKRVVVLNRDLEPKGIMDRYNDHGKEFPFGSLTSIFVVSSVGIYLVDSESSKILCIDFDGNLIRSYEKPDSNLFIGNTFTPKKVLVDSAQNVYALCSGVYQGAVVFDRMGRFTGYYGSTLVVPTFKVIIDSLWKKIMSEQQKDAMQRYIPIEYAGFDIDEKDFVYTVTQTNVLSKTTVRKLNPRGDNILISRRVFGDSDTYTVKGKQIATQFIDIHVDSEGFIYALDITGGKVFQYDSEGNLMFVFGRLGAQKGTFKQPVAVDSLGKTVLVLDKQKKCIYTFKLTEFGEYVREATVLYNNGLYDQAGGPWKEVVKRDGNYELAYVGLGKAAMNMYRYKEAMRYFRLGNDREYYSKAFKQYRIDYVRSHFSVIAACIIAVFLLLAAVSCRSKIRGIINYWKSRKFVIR